jgi:LPS export ABC transporter protein LptC
MFRQPRNLLWLIPVLLFVTSPLWKAPLSAFLRPRGDFPAPSAGIDADNRSRTFVLDAITITLYSFGKSEWVINAARAFTGASDREIGLEEVDAEYKGEKREKTLITSLKGVYGVDDQHLILIDDVVIVQPESRQRMYTDLLHYYNEGKKVVCPGWVRITGPDFTITAGRLDYDLVSNDYDFGGRVKVELNQETVSPATGET